MTIERGADRMSQSRGMSFAESLANVAVGLMVSAAVNLAVMPLFDLYPTPGDAIGLAAIFTIISIARSYVLRRMFNKRHIAR